MRVISILMVIGFSALTVYAQESDSDPLAIEPAYSKTLSAEKEYRTPLQKEGFALNLQPLLPSGWMKQEFSLAGTQQSPGRFQMFPTEAASLPAQGGAYNRGYVTRRKIHKYASIATLPLFAAEAVVGQKLYDENGTGSDSLRSAHTALTAGIGVLFGVNTVTGVWDLWDTRKIPRGRGKRLFHGITMLAADAGFLVTAALAPHEEDGRRSGNGESASAHRTAAYAALGIATVSYLYMLVAR